MAATIRTILEDAVLRRRAWNMPFDAIDPTGADDHFLHLRNTGARSLFVVEAEISSTVAGNVEPFRASGVGANTPVPIVPRSLSGPGGAGPSGIFETGVNLDLTVDEVMGHRFHIADTPRVIKFAMVIPPNTAWALNWEAATGILSGSIQVIELSPEDDPA